MHPNIQDKVAVVTGGSRGIGYAIANALLENGASVLICSRQKESLERAVQSLRKKAGSKIAGMAADVRNLSEVEKTMTSAAHEFGGIDILVNNAGIGIFRSVERLSVEEWDAVIGTNLT